MTGAERFVQRFTELWAKPEPVDYASLWHSDGTLLHPGMEAPIGAHEIPGYVGRLLEALPDITLEPNCWAAQGDKVLIEWTITASFGGRKVSWDGADRFTLRGDRAIEGVAYFDMLPIWRRIDPSIDEAVKQGASMITADASPDVKEIFHTYAATFATLDPDAIVKLHSTDTQFWLHTGEEPIHGREGVRRKFAGFFEQWPAFGFDVYRVFVGDRHWVLDWALTSVLTNPDESERPIRFDCLDVVEINDEGLVTRKDTFVDLVQAQLAVAPSG